MFFNNKRVAVTLISLFFVFASQLSQAKSINGNLEATVSTENGIVSLKIVNKSLDVPAQLTGITILSESKQEFPLNIQGGQIAPSINVEIGSLTKLADIQQRKSYLPVAATENTNTKVPQCIGKHCIYTPLVLKINVSYGKNAVQENLTSVFIVYIAQ